MAKAVIPDYALGNHNAALGLTFSSGTLLPDQYRQGAFVGEHGSWNRIPKSGYKDCVFELELELLDGRLRAKDLSEAWRAAMQAYLGIVPTDDRDGCLQDVHWYAGSLGGAFQSYTIGNVLSAQFYSAAVKAHPDIPSEIAMGEFRTLHAWLREHLYQHGRKFKPYELVERTTSERMSTGPYLAYLRAKYAGLYQLSPVEKH